MATEIIMPKMGMGMEEGTVVEWIKKKGDPVKKGESIVSISSDKIEKDIEAPEDGVLIDIEAEENDVVPIGRPLGYIGKKDEASPSEISMKPDKDPADGKVVPDVSETASNPERIEKRGGQPLRTGDAPGTRRLRISPAARKLAREKNIDLSEVKGTGPSGRITKADVAAAEKARRSQSALPETEAPRVIKGPDAEEKGHKRKVAGMRKVIAQRMYDSLQQTAQLTLQTTADVTDLIAFQKKARAALPIDEDVRLTITDFIAKAAVGALLTHKEMNSIYQNETIVTYDAVHLGVAVALEEGLVVPVIRDADKKSISTISREIRKASKAARGGRLDTLTLSGSTFTVTSLGTYGIGFFTPVLNPPEIGILGVGTIEQKPVYAGDELQKRSLLPLSLTFDHRAIDGAPAAEFLSAVKANLEAPLTLVL